MIEKRSEHRLKKEKFIFVKNIVLTRIWFVDSIFYEFPAHYMEKQCYCHLNFLLKTKAKFTNLRTL